MELSYLIDKGIPIIFYDGGCGVCNRFIIFCIKRLKAKNHLYFAPLNGKKFEIVMNQFKHGDFPDSLVAFDSKNNKITTKSSAIYFVLKHLRRPWWIFSFSKYLIPKIFADFCYYIFSRYRRLIPTKKSCFNLSQEQRTYFE